jgi:hypothetical protein
MEALYDAVPLLQALRGGTRRTRTTWRTSGFRETDT